jgi:hypothetical protein
MRVLLSVAVSLLVISSSLAQSDGDYRSAGTGNWDQPGSWEVFNSGSWGAATNPPSNADGIITIRDGHTITVTSNVTADQIEFENNFSGNAGSLVVASGATLTIADGPQDDIRLLNDFFIGVAQLTVQGTLVLQAGATMVEDDYVGNGPTPITPLTYHIASGGVHLHETGTTVDQIPNADWQTGSTCRVRALTGSAPAIDPSTIFYDFEWDGSGQTTVLNLNGALLNVTNDFLISSTNDIPLLLSATTAYTLNVGGDFTIAGISRVALTQSATATINVAGNFTISSTSSASPTIVFATTGSAVVNVTETFSKSGASSVWLGAAASGSGTLNIGGGFNFTGGLIARGLSGTGAANINFVGTTPQSYSNPGSGIFTNAINFHVQTNANLDLGTSALGGSGSFTNDGTIHVGSLNPGGAIQGNIPSGTRFFNAGSTIIYDGAGAQFMGVSIPGSVNTIINNANGVTLATDVEIGGNLTLSSGNLNVDQYTLTLGGTVTANGNAIVVSPTSSIVINGSGPFGTFPFAAGPQTFSDFTLNRPGQTVTFAMDATVTGAVTLTNGTLAFPGQSLTLSGTFAATGGALSADDASVLIIEGNGALGTLEFTLAGNTLGTLTLNRTSGSVTLDGNLLIAEALNLTVGDFNNVSGLTLADDATLTRANNGQLLGEPILTAANEYYNVTYTGQVTTGVELPDPDQDNLKDLTINGGPVTLSNDIVVHGDVNLLSSSLNPDGHTITLAGQPGVWNRQSGTFASSGSTVIITGDITVTASTTPQLHNLTLSDGSTLTTSAGRINISGNLLVDAGSTFIHNNGTLAFNGSGDQDFGGAGKTYNNLIVDKSGGNVQFTSSVSLTGRLTIESPTTVITGGVLTLLSTSDGATGNGSIGPIPTGASISGNVSVRRYMSEEGRIYRYISSPIQSMTVAQLQAAGIIVSGDFDGASPCLGCQPSMYWWDETLGGDNSVGYVPFPSNSAGESMEVGRGYATFVADDVIPGNVTISYSGTINWGDISLPVTYTDTGNPSSDGWNLVGNPYPSSIDWDLGWTKSGISPVIAIRDNGGGGVYQYWDGTGVPDNIPNGVIATGQAFWVRATGANPQLVIHESAKSSQTGIFFRKDTREEVVPTLAISLKKGADEDVAYYKIRKGATPELDDLDGPKLNNVIFDISTLTPEGISMAINATDKPLCGEPLRLRIQDVTNGTYQISAQRKGLFEGYQVTLVDKYTSMNFDLTSGDEYEFTVTNDAATKAHDRFSVILTEPAIDPGNLIAELSDNVCADGHYKITLNGAQTGVSYFAELDGKVLGDSVMTVGTDPITLSIPASELEVGVNELTIKGFNYCTALAMNDVVSVEHDVVYTALSADKSSCGDDVVTLEASGAPANGSYNWYEEETSATPIEGQHGSTFVTPSLPKSATYYVAAVNALGCEGPRVPVKAIINEEIEPVAISGAETGELVSSYDEGNQWYFNGAVIEGETGPTYTATESGTYTVVVNVDGCETSASVDYLVTGVDEVADGRLLQVERNPFVDELRIRVVSPAEVTQMSVFDNVGALIGNMELRRSAGSTEGVIDMKQAASGMYFVRAMVKDEVYTLKVIKK